MGSTPTPSPTHAHTNKKAPHKNLPPTRERYLLPIRSQHRSHQADRYTSVDSLTVDRYTSVVFRPVHHSYTSVDGYTLVVGILRATLHTTFTVE
jgi:hypothetical protein